MEKYSSKFSSDEPPTRHQFFSARPKSSPSLRSNSTVNEIPPQVAPSYQQRRLQRHGSATFSRPTTATLRQHSRELIYQTSRQKLFESKSFVHQPQSLPSSPRREAWDGTPSTTANSKPALLRPHTAVLLRRRLRHIVKNRVKSAHPLRSNSFVNDGVYAEEELDEQSVQFGNQTIDNEERNVSVSSVNRGDVSKNATSNVSVKPASKPIIGWSSVKPKSGNVVLSDLSSRLQERSGSQQVVDNSEHNAGADQHKQPSDREVSHSDSGSAISRKDPDFLDFGSKSESPPSAFSAKERNQKAHNDISRTHFADHEHSSKPLVPSESESPRSSTPPVTSRTSHKSGSDEEYTPPVLELRLGNNECSIPLQSSEIGKPNAKSVQNQASKQRKASVAAMMKRNRHSRQHRLSVYLRTAPRKSEAALDKFRRICKTIRVIAGICIALRSYVKEGKTKQWSLVEMQLNLKADMEKALTFDPLMFSNLHVSRGSHKLKIILSKLPRFRTQKDIDVVVALLRKNRTFANYHRDTQLQLARVMEYQRFEARRIVLKEGHAASCYYIILSGVCLVNQLDFDRRNNSQFVTTVKEIGPGDCFGEVSLLTDTLRESSIICKEEVELLLINKDDFMSIIRHPMENEQKELVKFCVLREVFTDDMFANIKSNYKTILRQYYKPGVVVSKDLNKDDYIYVIKLGNCRVLSEIIEPSKKKESTSKSLSDDSWKKKAAIKRSMSLLGSSKRRAGWAAYAKKKVEEGTSQLPATSTRTNRGGADSTIKNDFNAIPASEYLAAHVALQKETKTADKTAVSRAWRRVTAVAKAASEQEIIKNEEMQSKAVESKNSKTTFAQVADISSGAVCGLETLLNTFRPETRLCLVSDGVDCILVSKKVFNSAKNTAKTVDTVNKLATEYPTSKDQLTKIVRARTWATYKDKLVGDIVYCREASRGKVL